MLPAFSHTTLYLLMTNITWRCKHILNKSGTSYAKALKFSWFQSRMSKKKNKTFYKLTQSKLCIITDFCFFVCQVCKMLCKESFIHQFLYRVKSLISEVRNHSWYIARTDQSVSHKKVVGHSAHICFSVISFTISSVVQRCSALSCNIKKYYT